MTVKSPRIGRSTVPTIRCVMTVSPTSWLGEPVLRDRQREVVGDGLALELRRPGELHPLHRLLLVVRAVPDVHALVTDQLDPDLARVD